MDASYPVADPATRTVRVCADRCDTCILRPRTAATLRPGRVRQLLHDAAAAEGHVVCHATLDTPAPAICAGYAAHPLAAARSLALRAVRAGAAALQPVTPPTHDHADRSSDL